MAKRPEESDGRVVPEGRRKAVQTAAMRGGKATTASEMGGQLRLLFETAESPKGAYVEQGGPSHPESNEVPKSKSTRRSDPPAMTMEEVASDENLREAFEEVARNRGAAGPDGQGIDEVRESLDEILVAVRSELLAGRYRPGMIRRVWIPKPGGGERGLGIPNVVDRVVQQAVHRIGEKLRALISRNRGWSLDWCIKHVNQYLDGWMNFFGRSCTEEFVFDLRVLDVHVRRRLRALLLRQWKRKRSIARRLGRLGVAGRTAWRTVYDGRKSIWALVHTNAVGRALGSTYFQKRGLVSLETLYRDLARKLIAPVQLTLGLGQLRAAPPALDVRD
jgi:hypothetical protein